jgi:hypothetical protein
LRCWFFFVKEPRSINNFFTTTFVTREIEMSDKRTSRADKAAEASKQLQGRACGYLFGMSPMHGEIMHRLPAIMTERELEEFTGVPVERDSR